MNNEGKIKRFGRYLLFDHLVDGGMAKICRARFLSEDVDRIVAIKMIQSQFSEDESFKKMFFDEIKITFGLNHPNIAQIYDYGFYQNQLYTAMEFVDGKNLKQYLQSLKNKNYVFPIEISVYIMSQVCQGLLYAYNFRDKLSGKKQNIIHRDISPHNIMLTFDGAVKIIDFGIAKSATSSDNTKVGTIKGKLSYLAPECLDGIKLDHRYDQFAVGVTLWELLCSRKLFHSKNGLAVLKKIQACKIPNPSHINPNVPEELDKIVMKTLARDRNHRFENMDKLNRMLIKFLYSNYPNFNSSDLSSFAKALFKDEIKRDRAKLFELGKIDISPYIEDWEKEISQSGSEEGMVGERKGGESFYLCDVDDIKNASGSTEIALNRESSLKETERAGERRLKRKYSKLKSKEDVPQKESKKNNGILGMIVAAGIVLGFCYMAKDSILEHPDIKAYISKTFPKFYKNSTDNSSGRTISSTEEKMGKLRLIGFKKSAYILLINGAPAEYDYFFIELPLGKDYRIEVAQKGRKSFVRAFTLNENNPEVRYEVSKLPLEILGEIYAIKSISLPKGSILEFEVDGGRIIKTIPFDSHRLPPGTYAGSIKNVKLGIQKEIFFTVEEGKKTQIAIH